MVAEAIEGLTDFARATDARAKSRRDQAEDFAASRTLPGCSGALALLDELELLVEDDPARARRLYFAWRRKCDGPPGVTKAWREKAGR